MGRSAPHLSIFCHAAYVPLTRKIAFLRVVPSYCEWLHGGHPSRPLHAQHRVASGREEETRWSRDETGSTDHESMISCNLEHPTKPPRHCCKSTTLANRVLPKPILGLGHQLGADEYQQLSAKSAEQLMNALIGPPLGPWHRPTVRP